MGGVWGGYIGGIYGWYIWVGAYLCLVPLDGPPDARGIHEPYHALCCRIPGQVRKLLVALKGQRIVPWMRPIPVLTRPVSPRPAYRTRTDDLRSSSAPARTWRRNSWQYPLPSPAYPQRSSASSQTVLCRRPGRSWRVVVVHRPAPRGSRGYVRG